MGAWHEGDLVAAIDMILRFPAPTTAWIGLLLVDAARQGQGLGRATYQRLEQSARSWPWCQELSLSVIDTNASVVGFWQRMGFITTGGSSVHQHDALTTTARSLTKHLLT